MKGADLIEDMRSYGEKTSDYEAARKFGLLRRRCRGMSAEMIAIPLLMQPKISTKFHSAKIAEQDFTGDKGFGHFFVFKGGFDQRGAKHSTKPRLSADSSRFSPIRTTRQRRSSPSFQSAPRPSSKRRCTDWKIKRSG